MTADELEVAIDDLITASGLLLDDVVGVLDILHCRYTDLANDDTEG